MYKINVLGAGKYLPKKIISNCDLEKLVDTSDEWITSRTGIKERRKSDISVVDMGYLASLDVISKLDYNVNKIDLIIVATITNEFKSPSVASLIQEKLGLNDKHVMAFDINAACTGFIYAMEMASALLNSNNYRSALVIGSEQMTNIVDYTDRNTCILFGDGAGAVIIENGHDESHFYNDSKGDNKGILRVKDYVDMNGPRVYQFAVDIIPKTIDMILKKANLSLKDLDIIIPHQANIRIIDSMKKDLNINDSLVFENIEKYGNTSAASIPIALAEYKENNMNKINNILLVGFGAGFTWGASLIKL